MSKFCVFVLIFCALFLNLRLNFAPTALKNLNAFQVKLSVVDDWIFQIRYNYLRFKYLKGPLLLMLIIKLPCFIYRYSRPSKRNFTHVRRSFAIQFVMFPAVSFCQRCCRLLFLSLYFIVKYFLAAPWNNLLEINSTGSLFTLSFARCHGASTMFFSLLFNERNAKRPL